MKKLLLSVVACMMVAFAFAQYPTVTIQQINASSATDLQACVDTSAYFGDTVRVVGTVVIDGNLSEVSSGSITGGSRPFISLVDTTNNGAAGAFRGLIVMGVNITPSNTPNTDVENALAGDILEITGVVGEFNGAIQLQPLDNNSTNIIGFAPILPTYATVPVSDLQDASGLNKLPTGEQWDGAYVEVQNVTVTSVSIFSGGSRCEFRVQDANGNEMLVADRFFPMRLSTQATVNPNSPDTVGPLTPPVVGQVYTYIRGLIFQDENGCAGGGTFAGGYEINPFDTNDVQKAAAVPPQISLVKRNPVVPSGSQSTTVTADIIDTDGTVASATLYYSADLNAARNTFSSVTMTNTGSLFSATIPSFPNDSIVRYYIEAVDNGSNVSSFPGPNTVEFYTVRPNGMIVPDIQFNLPGSLNSPYEGDTVTVKGIVTASYQPNDLGYLYIQDATASEYAGIFVEGGGTSVFGLNRGDEVTVTGSVVEQFGFTKIVAISVTATGSTGTITPTVLNPSDTTFFTSTNRENLEKYESMLLSYKNPQAGGKVNIINPNLGFGEYTVGSGVGATVDARVLAGRQQGTQAQSSLNVSVLSDTAAYAAGINVAAVQATIAQNMDELVGLLYYSFGNYKLTPRNNADFIGFNQPLVSIAPLYNNKVESAIYPNPAEDRVNIRISNDYDFDVITIQVMDMTGRVVLDVNSRLNLSSINLDELEKGLYMIRVLDNNEVINASKLILK